MFNVLRDDSYELRDHVEKFHYLHRWPTAVSLPFGYILTVNNRRRAPDGRLWGFIVMKKPQHHRQNGLFGLPGLPTAWQVLDLSRVWINPCLQGKSETEFCINRAGNIVAKDLNVFSQMTSKVLKRVQADWLIHHPPRYPNLPYHIMLIISYCQLDHHDGTGYRASGFKSIGKSTDKTKEVYIRNLRQPLKDWVAPSTQLSLLKEE